MAAKDRYHQRLCLWLTDLLRVLRALPLTTRPMPRLPKSTRPMIEQRPSFVQRATLRNGVKIQDVQKVDIIVIKDLIV